MFQYTKAAQLCFELMKNGDGAEVSLKKVCQFTGIAFSNRQQIRKTKFYQENCVPFLNSRKIAALSYKSGGSVSHAV